VLFQLFFRAIRRCRLTANKAWSYFPWVHLQTLADMLSYKIRKVTGITAGAPKALVKYTDRISVETMTPRRGHDQADLLATILEIAFD